MIGTQFIIRKETSSTSTDYIEMRCGNQLIQKYVSSTKIKPAQKRNTIKKLIKTVLESCLTLLILF